MIVGQLGPAQAHAQAGGHGVGGQVVDQRAEARPRVVLAGVDQLADVGPGDRGQVGQHGGEPGAEGGRVEAVLEDRAIDDLEVEVEPGEAARDVDQDQIGIGQDAGVGQAGPQRAELAPHTRMPQRQMILAVAVHAADRLDPTRVDDPGRRPVEPRQPQAAASSGRRRPAARPRARSRGRRRCRRCRCAARPRSARADATSGRGRGRRSAGAARARRRRTRRPGGPRRRAAATSRGQGPPRSRSPAPDRGAARTRWRRPARRRRSSGPRAHSTRSPGRAGADAVSRIHCP
jgi:hypothetical protein